MLLESCARNRRLARHLLDARAAGFVVVAAVERYAQRLYLSLRHVGKETVDRKQRAAGAREAALLDAFLRQDVHVARFVEFVQKTAHVRLFEADDRVTFPSVAVDGRRHMDASVLAERGDDGVAGALTRLSDYLYAASVARYLQDVSYRRDFVDQRVRRRFGRGHLQNLTVAVVPLAYRRIRKTFRQVAVGTVVFEPERRLVHTPTYAPDDKSFPVITGERYIVARRQTQTMAETQTTPEELDERLGDDDLTVVDVRHADSYEDWHVPGSENVDVYDELKEDDEAAADALDQLPEDKQFVTVCGVGKVAADAAELMREMGYDATTLSDGMVGWSRVHRKARIDAQLDATVVQVARPGTGCLSHIVVSDGEAAVFDPSSYVDEYEEVVDEHGATVAGVFDTHAHADHVSGGRKLAGRVGVPYHLHPADDLGIDATPVEDGDEFGVGNVVVEVVGTPGHSPGSVSYAVRDEDATDDEVLLTGDTLFHDTVGRVELGVDAGIEDVDVRDNAETLYDSLRRLVDRDGNPLVLPAHHPGTPNPPCAERMSEVEERNQGLRRPRDEFVDTLANDVPEQPPNFERIKRVNAGAEEVADDEVEELEAGPNNCAAE